MSELPTVTDPVVIDGRSQGSSATPLIELNGTNAGVASGIRITSGGSIAIGLAINRFSRNGILLIGAKGTPGNIIQGNFIGVDVTGRNLWAIWPRVFL